MINGKAGPRHAGRKKSVKKEKPKLQPKLTVTKTKTPRQKRFETMDDPIIEGLQGLAEEYYDLKEKRQRLKTREVELKAELLAVMKGEDKTSYHYQGVTIKVTHEREGVSVRVVKTKEAQAA